MRTGAIVVLYEPQVDVIRKELSSLAEQVSLILFVDNSKCDNSIVQSFFTNAKYISMGGNAGIAAAQNRGIKYLKDNQFDFVFFSDQDSMIPAGFVEALSDAYFKLKQEYDIAAIGPIPINKHNNKPYFSQADLIYEGMYNDLDYYLVDSVMSSCSMVAINTFAEVGLFEETLFIDGVDNEWGWRAHSKYQKINVVIPKLRILHELGTYKKFLSYDLNISSPFRIYFQVRNLLWLSNRDYVPRKWKHKNLLKMFLKVIMYPCFFSPRSEYLKNIIRGIKDGLSVNK